MALIESIKKKIESNHINFSLIGLSGKNYVGKDTVAAYLKKNHGYIQYAYADPIKEIGRLMFGFSENQLYGNKKEEIDTRYNITPRDFFQKFGTEFGQFHLYELFPNLKEKIPERHFWVHCFHVWLEKKIDELITINSTSNSNSNSTSNSNSSKITVLKILVSDIRFFHEAESFSKLGGKIYSILRPTSQNYIKKINVHLSQKEVTQIPDEWFFYKNI